jgi:hypothetical protein
MTRRRADICECAGRKQSPLPNTDLRRRVLAFRRCSVVRQGTNRDDAVRRCTAFAEAHTPDDDEPHLSRLARSFTAMSPAEPGRFFEAEAIMKNLAHEDPARARLVSLEGFGAKTQVAVLTGRLLLSRAPADFGMLAQLDACAAHGTAVELNANPARLDFGERWLREAKARGVLVSIRRRRSRRRRARPSRIRCRRGPPRRSRPR